MTDLERRLRVMFPGDPVDGVSTDYRTFDWKDVLEAARIGAEVEREEIARIVESLDGWEQPGVVAEDIRARGKERP